MRELYQKNLVPITRLSQLEREATRLGGERGQLIAATAQAKGKIAELQLQIIQVDQDLSSEVAKEMREIDARIGEFVERKVSALRSAQAHRHPRATGRHRVSVDRAHDRRRHSGRRADHDDRAGQRPADGGGKVNPQDIDKVAVGQSATLRFSAFNFRTTPEIFGRDQQVSADITTDQRTSQSYYTIRIAMPPEEVVSPRQCQTGAGNAGRGLCEDRRAHGDVVSDEAAVGPDQPRVP